MHRMTHFSTILSCPTLMGLVGEMCLDVKGFDGDGLSFLV